MWCYGYTCSGEELYHHGILGQKWGVRRYQNYDGTYTQKGLQRYNQAKEKADEASQNLKDVKAARKSGTATKSNVRVARVNRDLAQTEQMKAYKNLKNDYNADKGRELYSQGKTITGNSKASNIRNIVTTSGLIAAQQYVSKNGINNTKSLAAATIAVGAKTANTILNVKEASQDKKLRAYYAHK